MKKRNGLVSKFPTETTISGLILTGLLSGCAGPTGTEIELSPFETFGNKIILTESDQRPQWQRRLNQNGALSSAATHSPSSIQFQPLVALVDRKCAVRLNRSYSSQIPDGTSARVTIRFSSTSKGASKTSLSTLRKRAEQDQCLIGIGPRLRASQNTEPRLRANPSSGRASADDPLLPRQAHHTSLDLNSAYQQWVPSSAEQQRVVVAVIDSGIELQHPDLRSRLWRNDAEANGQPGVDDDGNGYVDDVHGFDFQQKLGDPSHKTYNDHGTHVAGIIAALHSNHEGGAGILGHGVRVMALNVFGRQRGADTETIDEAIRYATAQGAHVINLSLGAFGVSPTTAAAITEATRNGALVVSSAGNAARDIDQMFYFPASYASQIPGLVAVGAVDVAGQGRCEFTNFGSQNVTLFASGCSPGARFDGIFSTRSRGRYGKKKGTSQSAPQVAGIVALGRQIRTHQGRTLGPAEAERLLERAMQRPAQGGGIRLSEFLKEL